jgi:hypothetical protein
LIIKEPRVVVVEPVFEAESESFSAATKGVAASEVAGDLQLMVKIKTRQTKILKKTPHFFIASSPFLVMVKQSSQNSNVAS